jgi:hypothetical protein
LTARRNNAEIASLDTPDIHTPHSRHGGGLPRWLELIIAITALITSISSIAIAIHHGRIMEMLVQANSLPYLQGGVSSATVEGGEVLSLDLLNRGVGPAHEESLQLKIGDAYVTSLPALYAAVLGPEQAKGAQQTLHPIFNRVRTRFIPGGQSQMVFRLSKTPDNAQLWDLLAKDQSRWDIQYCFCSVFHECWIVHSKLQEPETIKACRRDESREFTP